MEHKIKILIVEDEALIAENLKITLEDLGYDVVDTCYTFSRAVESIRHNMADLVMLDINLGGKNENENGFALASLLNQECKKPFIFLTAYSDLDTIRHATKLHPDGYLIKPVNAAALFATIQTAIEHNLVAEDLPVDTSANHPDFFFVKLGAKKNKVMWDEVYCLESGKNYVKLKLFNVKTEYPIRGSLTFVVEQLLPLRLHRDFIRINRSTYLNRNFITSFTPEIIFCGTEQFENTRVFIKQLINLLKE